MSARLKVALSLSLALALLLVGTFAGCGSDRDVSEVTTDTTTAAAPQAAHAAPEAHREKGDAKEKTDLVKPKPVVSDTERTPGTKTVAPAVPVSRGGDNSIQAFGLEGEIEQGEQAVAMLRQYLRAVIAEDWQGGCAAASDEFRQNLAELAAGVKVTPAGRAKGKSKPEGCAEALALLIGGSSEDLLGRTWPVKVLSFRIRGAYAYLIFETTRGAAAFVAMRAEDGEWRVNNVTPNEFPGPGNTQGSSE